MSMPICVNRTTPLRLTGDVDAGWTLHVDGAPLLSFPDYATAAQFLSDMGEHLNEADEAEAAAQAQVDEDERRHQREECTFTTSGAW